MTEDLVSQLEELLGVVLDTATELQLALADLVFAQPPLTEEEQLEAAA